MAITQKLVKLEFDAGYLAAQTFEASLRGEIGVTRVLLRLEAMQKRGPFHSEQREPRLQHLNSQSSNDGLHDKSFKAATRSAVPK